MCLHYTGWEAWYEINLAKLVPGAALTLQQVFNSPGIVTWLSRKLLYPPGLGGWMFAIFTGDYGYVSHKENVSVLLCQQINRMKNNKLSLWIAIFLFGMICGTCVGFSAGELPVIGRRTRWSLDMTGLLVLPFLPVGIVFLWTPVSGRCRPFPLSASVAHSISLRVIWLA